MVRILVDSGADYEQEELRRLGLECVPITIRFGEETFLDGVELSKEAFYERLETQFPATSQPTPLDFAEHFRSAREAGDELVAILLSSSLSGTYQGACLAREDVGGDGIYLIDSKSATIGIQVLVDYAVKLRDRGCSGQEIAEALRELQPRVKVFASMDTLEYLYKGGRLSRASAAIGTLSRLKPVIHLDESGAVAVVSKCLGMKRSIDALVAKVESYRLDPAFPIYPIYSRDISHLKTMVERLRDKGFAVDEAEGRNLGPTIGAHIGPGCCGVAFVAAEETGVC